MYSFDQKVVKLLWDRPFLGLELGIIRFNNHMDIILHFFDQPPTFMDIFYVLNVKDADRATSIRIFTKRDKNG